MKQIIKHIYVILMKSSILVGGQAVIEGVMMRVPGAYATAVRLKNNTIVYKKHSFTSIIEKKKLQNAYFIRGMVHLYESMKIGYSTLDWSAQLQEEEPTKNNKLLDWIMTVFSIFFALGIFVFLPLYGTSYFFSQTTNHPFYFNIIAGVFRISIFLIYLITISQLNDVKRLFAYHGAEHKTVYNFESGQELSIKNARSFSTKHPRCGTSFVFIIMLVTIFSYAIIDMIALLFIEELTYLHRLFFHIIFLPIVSGVGYEVLKFLAKHQGNLVCNVLSKPGLWLQHITTNEPSDNQLEVAIRALQEAFGDKIHNYAGKEFKADAIG